MRSFTLLEVLVSLGILSIIMTGIFSVLTVGDMSWRSDMGLLDIQQDSREAMAGMLRELRHSKASDATVSLSGARIDFLIPDVPNTISYYLNNNQIIREYPSGTTIVLANKVNSLNFCCLGGADCYDCSNSDSLQIQIQASTTTLRGRTLSFSLIEKVKWRNE